MCIYKYIYDFQALLVGLLALISAIATVIVLRRGQKIADRHHREKIDQAAAIERERELRGKIGKLYALAPQLHHVRTLCRQHVGTIKVLAAAQAATDDKMKKQLQLPEVPTASDWQALIDMDARTIALARDLRSNIDMHNWRVVNAQTYNVDAFRNEMFGRLDLIKGNAHELLSSINQLKLPQADDKNVQGEELTPP